MELKYVAVGLFRFTVDLLLLLGTNRMGCGMASQKRMLLAAALGGIHSWACLQTGFSFLGNVFWRSVALLLTGGIAFGWNVRGIQSQAVFVLLTLALQGVTAGVGSMGPMTVLLGLVCLCVICILGFGGRPSAGACVNVELNYRDKNVRVVALRDTGNMLRDPVTGQSVLVVDSCVAQALTGLTPELLERPVETMTAQPLPGLRLIPYQALGNEGGLLLALRLPKVKIGSWQGSSLVAFAPGLLTAGKGYQALTGGTC